MFEIVIAMIMILAVAGLMYGHGLKHPKPDWLTEEFRRENRGV